MFYILRDSHKRYFSAGSVRCAHGKLRICTIGLFIIGLGLSLTSCGFHLRGSVQVDSSLAPIYVQDNGGSRIKPVLNQLLETNGIAMANSIDSAQSVLVIQREAFKRRVLSVGGAGKVQEFELQYLMQYSILGGDKQELVTPQQLRLTRDLRFDETAVLAKAQEESQRNQDMVMDAARQILRRLQSVSSSNADNGGTS